MFSSSDENADNTLHLSIAESPNNPTSATLTPKQNIKIKLRRKPYTAPASYTTQVNDDDDTVMTTPSSNRRFWCVWG
jgi:hypothetical protein